MLLLLGAPVAAAARPASDPAARMAFLVNQARMAQGLNPVAVSAELTAAAVAHARDMIAHGYMDHTGRDGSSPQQRAARHGYRVPGGTPWIVVEVISARATAEAAANWLLSDPLHRGVMLRKGWREIGVGYVQGGAYGQLWAISFGCRPNVLPVHAEPTDGGTTLRLTNEECAPAGGNADQMGQATQVMVSERADFDGASWQPFTPTRTVGPGSGSLFVKLRDSRGRESTAVAAMGPATLTAASATEPVAVPPPDPSATTAAPAAPPDSTESAPPTAPAGLFDPGPGILQR